MSGRVDTTITALKPRMEMPNGCGFTLVEYDPPVRLISTSIEEVKEEDDEDEEEKEEEEMEDEEDEASPVEAVLSSIFPARVWEEDGVEWQQVVKMSTPCRSDVKRTQELLTIKLAQQSARDEGICQVRRELYAQCFEELIRQSLLSNLERGLLLLRLRDEFRMTLYAAKTLYESSIAFGGRQAVKAEAGRHEVEEAVSKLKSECFELRRQVDELKVVKMMMEKRVDEELVSERKQFAEEIRFHSRTNQQLKAQLDGIMAQKDIK